MAAAADIGKVDRLVLRIYDTVTQPGDWQPLLNELTSALGARALNLCIGNPAREHLDVVHLSDVLGDFFDDPAREVLVSRARPLHLAIPELLPARELYPVPELLRRRAEQAGAAEDLRDLDAALGAYGVRHRAVCHLHRQPNYFDFLTVSFAEGRPTERAEAIATGNRLMPHLARALELGRPFAQLQRRYRSVLDVLDRLQLGVVFLGLDRQLWLRRRGRHLRPHRPRR